MAPVTALIAHMTEFVLTGGALGVGSILSQTFWDKILVGNLCQHYFKEEKIGYSKNMLGFKNKIS